MNGFTFYSNYKKDKLNLYSSIALNNRMRIQKGYRRIYKINNGSNETYECSFCYDYDFESEGDRTGNSINLGSDYAITEKLNINLDMTYKNHYKIKKLFIMSQNPNTMR